MFCCFSVGRRAPAYQEANEQEYPVDERGTNVKQALQPKAAAVGPQLAPDGINQTTSFSHDNFPTQLSQVKM